MTYAGQPSATPLPSYRSVRAWPSVIVLALSPWRSTSAAPAWSDTTALDTAFAELTALASLLPTKRPIDCGTYRRDVAPLVRTIPARMTAIEDARRRILVDVFDDWLAQHAAQLERYTIAVEHLRRDKACRAIRDDDAAHQTARLILAFAKRPPLEPRPRLHCNGDLTFLRAVMNASIWEPPSVLDTLAAEVLHEDLRRLERSGTACLAPIPRSQMGEL
jgi:hypothetical protein